jgi:anti-sigma regulatory factor (Ser/Thr protein kinase)
VYLTRCGKQIAFTNVFDYLERIGLGNGGIKPDTMRQTEFLAELEKYTSKTYIPIIDFAAGRNSDAKEVVSSIVENMIIQQLNIQSNVANGFKYMIDETLDNITEHSESDRGYIFAQAYPTKRFLDVCIADRGVSLLGSYEKLPDNEILSDMEAIKAANRGLSSKNLPDAENRGFGIRTSKQMLIHGLGGQYLMISGSSLYLKSCNLDTFYSMPHGLRWNGTIVALRIPYHSSSFNYINYIE